MKKSQLKKLAAYETQLLALRADIKELQSQVVNEFWSKSRRWQLSDKGQNLHEQMDSLEKLLINLTIAEESIQDIQDFQDILNLAESYKTYQKVIKDGNK